jgi:hypothetical protein
VVGPLVAITGLLVVFLGTSVLPPTLRVNIPGINLKIHTANPEFVVMILAFTVVVELIVMATWGNAKGR